ncbi:MAG: hypothetical protein OEX22_04480 [Cyclobacteriaceae bacterium]|nr:hypothetical protein [Cyclobacteriaceae bacterium]
MKNITQLFIVFVLFFNFVATAQGVEELGKRNGFKDIKLASDVNQYEGLEYEKEIDDEKFGKLQIYIPKKEHYTSIGIIKIVDMEVRAYNGEVYEVQVIINKDPKMYGGLKKAFGPPKYSPVTNDYFWRADSLKLMYRSFGKNQLEMVYHSYVIDRKLKDEKKEEIDDIASDF